jgi:hypothetical protein
MRTGARQTRPNHGLERVVLVLIAIIGEQVKMLLLAKLPNLRVRRPLDKADFVEFDNTYAEQGGDVAPRG